MSVLFRYESDENIKNTVLAMTCVISILFSRSLKVLSSSFYRTLLKSSTAPKRGSVFIRLMTPDGAIWSRYQRAVLMR